MFMYMKTPYCSFVLVLRILHLGIELLSTKSFVRQRHGDGNVPDGRRKCPSVLGEWTFGMFFSHRHNTSSITFLLKRKGTIMKNIDIARAWKDQQYRISLTSEEQAALPQHPSDTLELTDEELAGVNGASGPCYGFGGGYNFGGCGCITREPGN